MKLKNLKLINFRNHSNLDLKFSDNYNILYGNNGQGKTNLVESIYYLAMTKSFRANKDELMLKKNEKYLKVSGNIKSKVESKYEIIFDHKTKEVLIDGAKQSKLSDYVTKINVILFSPEDIFLIRESPVERRKLINIEISKLHKEYLYILSNYNKILIMRNAYLKILKYKKTSSLDYLDILTNDLIKYGIKIYEYRLDFIKDINKYIGKCYESIFGYGQLEIKYNTIFKNKSLTDILKIYQENYDKEIVLGKTMSGVHHDDIIFYLDNNKLKEWGSIGQYKNSILAFKLAEIEMLKKLNKDSPILILDDLFSEIDNEKIKNILNIIDKSLQVFITTTDISKFKFDELNDYKIFKIENEEVVEEKNE